MNTKTLLGRFNNKQGLQVSQPFSTFRFKENQQILPLSASHQHQDQVQQSKHKGFNKNNSICQTNNLSKTKCYLSTQDLKNKISKQKQFTMKGSDVNNSQKSIQKNKSIPCFEPKINHKTIEFCDQDISNPSYQEEIKGSDCKQIYKQCEKHKELSFFTEEANRKIIELSQRLSRAQKKNKQLCQQIEKGNESIQRHCKQIMKLEQQKEELFLTRQKWENGKMKLELLLKEVSLRAEREKQDQKQNMGREQCEIYFGHKSKSHLSKQKERKANISERLQLRVERV